MAIRRTRVDTTLSAVITDAGSFPPEATTPEKDEQRVAIYPLRIYEGWNYLPTSYGYKSYFGLDSALDATGLSPSVIVEDIFIYQSRNFTNVLVALTSHGVFVRQATAWVQLNSMVAPPANTSFPWTYTTINNILFMYRTGHTSVFCFEDLIDGVGSLLDVFNGMSVQPTRVDSATGLAVQLFEFVPTTLNMEGQVGIYRAGGSLGFWDTDDSIAWSAINDYTNFAPSLTTLANITKVSAQVGKITTIKPHGDGFVLYATRSIVYLYESNDSLLRYRSSVVLGNVGVAYPREVAVIQPDTTHFAWTSMGLVQITDGDAKPIVTEFSDYVKQTRTPQYMQVLNNRYLCIGVMDPNFIEGNVEFSTVTIDPEDWVYEGGSSGGALIDGIQVDGGDVCFIVDNSPIVAEGVKPYVHFPMYRHWPHLSASLVRYTKVVGTHTLRGWTTNPRGLQTTLGRNYLGLSIKTEEVPLLETQQIDESVEKQVVIYQTEYANADILAPQDYDDLVEAVVDIGGFQLVRGNPITRSMVDLDPANSTQEGNVAVDVISPTGQVAHFRLKALRSAAGDLYLADPNTGWSTVITGNLNPTQLDNPDYFGVASGRSLAYVKVGKWEEYNPVKVGNHWRLTIPATDQTALGEEDLEEFFIPDPNKSLVPDPSTDLRFVDDVKKGYKLRPFNNVLKVILSDADGLEFIRPVPTSISKTLGAWLGRILVGVGANATYQTMQINAKWDVVLHLEGGSSVLIDGGIAGATHSETLSGVYVPHTMTSGSSPQANYTEASNAFYSSITGYQAFLSNSRAVLRAAWDETLAAAQAKANAYGNSRVGTTHSGQEVVGYSTARPYGSQIGSITGLNYQGSASAGTLEPAIDGFLPSPEGTNSTQVLVYAGYTYKRVSLSYEHSQDYHDDLYGKLPVPLDEELQGISAWRNMPTDELAGLIVVDQWFYNRNRNRLQLDNSFLLQAATRVDVPLGSITPPGYVLAKAVSANTYIIRQYPTTLSNGIPNTAPQRFICGTVAPIDIGSITVDPIVFEPWEIENPPITWVMQNGSIAPFNPTMHGAYVYDMHLGKWGVFKGEHKHLVDYQPINNYSPGSVSYQNFMIDGGCLTPTYEVCLFTDTPEDGYTRYGKYQHIGSEFCTIETLEVTFNNRSTGNIAVQFSLDGRQLEYGLATSRSFNEALSTRLNCSKVGKWATITLTGHYDLASMRIESYGTGRR